MEADLAVVFALAGVAEVDIDALSTTALGVLDGGTLLLARRALLADAAVLHLVVEVKFDIVVDGDIDVSDGETLLPAVAAEGSRLLLAARVGHGQTSKSALGNVVTLANVLGRARPGTTEVEAIILAGLVTVLEVGPVVATLLLVGAFVVVVSGSVEVGSLAVPVCGDLLGSKARN